MANLLPEKMRRSVQARMRARFIIVSSCVTLVVAGVSFLILLPSYLALTTGAAAGDSSASAGQLSLELSDDTALMTNAKALLSELSPLVSASTTPTAVITEALSLRPPGITVDEISYTSGNPASLMLVGSAATNGAISAYKTALASDALFTSVSVPVGALVGTDGGRFSMTLSGDF